TSVSVNTKSGASFSANRVGPNSRKKPAAMPPITNEPNEWLFARYSVKGSVGPGLVSERSCPGSNSGLRRGKGGVGWIAISTREGLQRNGAGIRRTERGDLL